MGDILMPIANSSKPLSNAAHTISIFQINADGSLAKKPDFTQIPTAVSGIVAR